MRRAIFSSSELATTTAPQPRVPMCGACGLYKKCLSPKMVPAGRGRRSILVVGEAPGEKEDEDGRPFVSRAPAGGELRRVFRLNGVDLDRDCWAANALICRPPHNVIKDTKMIDYCRPNLLRTIAELDPEVIILLGGSAVRSFIGSVWKSAGGKKKKEVGVSLWAGWQIPLQRPNAWVCPTFHPSHVLRSEKESSGPVIKRAFEDHLAAALRLSGRPWDPPPDYAGRVEVIVDPVRAARRLRRYREGRVAFDYETNMLKPDSPQAEIVSAAVCWQGQETIAFPFHGPVKEALRDMLRNPQVIKTGANIKFEERWSRKILKTPVVGWEFDDMLGSHALDCRYGITGVKFQSFVRLGQPDYSSHVEPYLRAKGGNTVNRIREVNLPSLLLYNGMDALLEYLLGRRQRRELRL